ncbi:MAG TPA: FAD-dependent oxidoreductase [Desulfobulbaceae bacterium]|nr:FAD-dependent oxidoreductase [Desulfobulbaceae bacterium]
MKPRNIAIIGTGIAGLTCGYYLSRNHQVTLFEAAHYIGGHTHTVEVEKEGERSLIDTGFIVFNDRTYPNFIRLMEEIGVAGQATEMSFSVRNDQLGLEYNGGTIDGLFAQRKNAVSPGFLGMLYEITTFNKEVRQAAADGSHRTLGEFLNGSRYGSMFRENYLLPMVSAIWSMGLDDCYDFPLSLFVRFFDNHGLLDLTNRPQWRTIAGGSSSYIKPLTRGFADRIRLNTPVTGVLRQGEELLVRTAAGQEPFDEVIMACHGDQALRLLAEPTLEEKEVLGAFRFADNEVVLHTDISHLPRSRRAWASWNYRMVDSANTHTALTYDMNILQRLFDKRHTYLVTLNQEIDKRHVLARFTYSHPVYSLAAIAAQERWATISGTGGVHFCGSYWRNGFHEDGVFSALRVIEVMEAKP